MVTWARARDWMNAGGCWIGVFALCQLGFAQTPDQREQQLEQLRQRIARLQQQVAAFEKSESSALEFLRTLDEQIDLTSRLIGQVKRQEQAKRVNIAAIERTLQQTGGELQRLRDLAARRVVYFYKYGRMREIELLLASTSVHQVLQWTEFQRRLSDNDRRIIAGIARKRENIAKQRGLMAVELAEQQRILAEKQREESTLKQGRRQRQEVLRKVRKDKAYYQMQLAESQRAAERIKELIARAETAEAEHPPVQARFEDFSKLHGSLPWPAEGSIVSHYGPYRHPVLKTVTEHLGVDIAAPAGSPVRCVAAGKVTALTWQRGHGNLLIVSHAKGYFTIYTHLDDILVAPNDVVNAGQTLGTVGEAAGETPVLHFQIWLHSQHLNPEEWLR